MKIAITISFVLAVISFLFFFKKDNINEIEKETFSKKTVEVEKINYQKFSKKLKLRGFTQASRIVTLKSQVEGKISSKNFSKGNFYKAGKHILLIAPEDKVAKLKEMEALLNQRKKEYEVAENLYKKGFRSEVKLTESRIHQMNDVNNLFIKI